MEDVYLVLCHKGKIEGRRKRPWSWERLRAGGEGDDRGWDGWMVSPTQWTWVWVNSRSWWWTGRPGVLRFMGCKELDMTEQLNWTEEMGTTEDDMFGWHHRLNGCEFGQAHRESEGQENLMCCSLWSRKELDTTEWLNNTRAQILLFFFNGVFSKFSVQFLPDYKCQHKPVAGPQSVQQISERHSC